MQAMEVAVGLLRKCTTAGEMVANGQLHAALRLLLSVRAQLTPSRTTSISRCAWAPLQYQSS